MKILKSETFEQNFEFITYIHVHRSQNQVTNSLTNFVLEWHINHKKNKHKHALIR